MEITEVRIKLMEDSSDRLRAFCSITFDNCFVVRDLKVIAGSNGPFVAMPSRKLTGHCPTCGSKNHLRSAYCNQCGDRLELDADIRSEDGRVKLYADIAHPINSECRETIQERVLREYEAEMKLATEPGYRSRYDEYYGDEGEDYTVDDDSDDDSQSEPQSAKPAADTEASGKRNKESGAKEEASTRRVGSSVVRGDAPQMPPHSHVEPGSPQPPAPHTSRPQRPTSNNLNQSYADDDCSDDDTFGAGVF